MRVDEAIEITEALSNYYHHGIFPADLSMWPRIGYQFKISTEWKCLSEKVLREIETTSEAKRLFKSCCDLSLGVIDTKPEGPKRMCLAVRISFENATVRRLVWKFKNEFCSSTSFFTEPMVQWRGIDWLIEQMKDEFDIHYARSQNRVEELVQSWQKKTYHRRAVEKQIKRTEAKLEMLKPPEPIVLDEEQVSAFRKSTKRD